MAWRDKLKKASFRGKQFFVETTDTGVGRRTILHQYPFREEPYVEDLGADADEFTIVGYVIANKYNNYDHTKERDDLRKALKQEGSGTLVHPFYGNKAVSLLGKARIVENLLEGGIARFTMTFVTAGRNRYPINKENNVGNVDDEASKAEDNLQDGFGTKFLGGTLRGNSLTKITGDIRKLYSSQRKIMAAIQGGPRSLISAGLSYIDASAAGTFDSIMSDACSIASTLISSYNAFKNIGGIFGDLADNILTGICSGAITQRDTGVNRVTTSKGNTIYAALGTSIISQMSTLQNYDSEIVQTEITSASSAREAISRKRVSNLAKCFNLTAMTQLAVRIDYKSQDEAVSVLNTVTDVIDEQLDLFGSDANSSEYNIYGLLMDNDEEFIAIQDLRKVFVRSMMNIAAGLPSLVNYTTPFTSIPALVLAYKQYKDLDREDEIITRNQLLIPHPGFIPENEQIKILSY